MRRAFATCLVGLTAAGCASAHLGSPASFGAPVVELQSGWEVSFDAAGGSGFRPWNLGERLPERETGREPAWFRLRLPANRYRAPGVFFRALDTRCDVFLDGSLLAVPQPDAARVPAPPWVIAPLPADANGRLLALRCTSQNPIDIGPTGRVALGEIADLQLSILRQDGAQALVGIIALAIAGLSLVLFLRRREDLAYLTFAIWALGSGLALLSLTASKELLWTAPAFWQHALPLARLVAPPGLLATAWLLFPAGRPGARAVRVALAALGLVAALLLADIERFYPAVWRLLNLEQFACYGAAIALAVRAAMRREREAIIFLAAFAVLWAAILHDVLLSLHRIGGLSSWMAAGDLACITGVGAVVLGRLADVYEALRGHAAELQAANERLRAAEAGLNEAVQARDDFLSVASHELRTPLTALQLQIEVLRRAPAAALSQALDRLERQALRLGSLIASLLDVTRARSSKLSVDLEPVDLAALAREVVSRAQDAAAQKSCALELEAPAKLAGLWDPLRIEQVLGNLLSNAIKYGAGRPVRLRVWRRGGDALIEVSDRGIGIAPEDQARIFDRFERAVSNRHYGGLGLGLWIAREIVVAHGGRIEVESTLGEGTTFRVELPGGAVAGAAHG